MLSLRLPISKRRLRNAGMKAVAFEQRYSQLLAVDAGVTRYSRVLLVDDVCDHGSTMGCCAARLQAAHPGLVIVAAAAGQMAIKEAVRSSKRIIV